jgi:hypothetical protein
LLKNPNASPLFLILPRCASYLILAVTDAFVFSVNLQVLADWPPLEHAPLQTALRPFETVSVMDVPVLNDADMLLPDATLRPAGLEVTRTPERPLAVTVSDAVWAAGVKVKVAVREMPPALAVIVTGVLAVTGLVVTVKSAVLDPGCTVTVPEAGTAADVLLLETATGKPPAGAGPVRMTTACDGEPPMTMLGVTVTPWRVGGGGAAVKVRLAVFVTPL